MKRKVLIIMISFFAVSNLCAKFDIIQPQKFNKTSFAIIIDKTTYDNTKDAVLTYRDAVEKDGLATYIVIFWDEDPESIKKKIIELYSRKPQLEGVVFIGDVPIPMIRDAQHMTSAFKMDQERDRFDSSVPSDRYYEDFDLKFDLLGRDTIHTICYYYSLRGDSNQKITKEIYSARIRSPFGKSIEKYKSISDYLYKAVRAKLAHEVLDNALIYTGYGYHSESLTTWSDELVSLREQFSNLFMPGGTLKFIRFSMSRNMKGILMNELKNKKLDFALFHAHGDNEVQYLLDDPATENISDNVSWIQRFLRSKIRVAQSRKQDVEEAKNYYKKNYNIPESWFNGTFEDSVIKTDSIYGFNLDLHSDDLDRFNPEAKFVIFDQCFNGAFHTDNYVSGRYVFNAGNTIAAYANSVNVLQDIWANEFLGLLNCGVRVGQLHKLRSQYLENHIIGDPTFHFKNIGGFDLINIIDNNEIKTWKKLLNNPEPEIRNLAVLKLYLILGNKFENELVRIYGMDKSYNVRLQALSCLASLNSEAFREILHKAITDPFGTIRVRSAMFMGNVGDNEFIPDLIDRMLNDACSRVSYTTKNSLTFFDQDIVYDILKNKLEKYSDFFISDETAKMLLNSTKRSKEWLFDDMLKTMWDSDAKPRQRANSIRTFRNYNFNQGVPELIKFALNTDQPKNLRIASIEALGWFYYNLRSEDIIEAMYKLINDPSTELQIKNEAIKTKTRIIKGCNVALTP
ncbi:MAG: HEAT repeat domain-containing protein [Bacteroidota bacterium]